MAKGISAKGLAAHTEGLSGAEIESVCSKAALAAVRRAVAAEIAQEGSGEKNLLIRPEDIEEALEEMLGGSQ